MLTHQYIVRRINNRRAHRPSRVPELLFIFALVAWSAYCYSGELPLAVKIVACESSGENWRHGKLNCNKHEPHGRQSCGIAAFQLPTFTWFRHKAGVDTLDYRDPLHQLALLNWALDHGYGNNWTCYRWIQAGTWSITPALESKMRRNRWIQLMYGVQS